VQQLHKKKILGAGRFAIAIANTIQSGEHSTDGGADGVLHIADSDGNLHVFDVEQNDDGLWLNTYWNDSSNFWNPDNQLVFVRRNSLHFSPDFASGEFLISRNHAAQPSIPQNRVA
jgi:hypothetical protein